MSLNDHLIKALQRANELTGFGISMAELKSGRKPTHIAETRKIVSAYLRALDDAAYSYPRIAKMTGMKCHTSIMNHVRQAYAVRGLEFYRSLSRRDFPRRNIAVVEVHRVNAKQIEAIGESRISEWRAAA